MWLPREVTQRLIYFTGGRPPPPLLRLLLSHHQHRAYTLFPFPCGPFGASSWLCVAREGPAADIVPHTRPVSRLYTRLHRIYMRKESPPPFPPRFARHRRLLPPPCDPSPGAPRSSLQCKHGSSLSPGSLYFKGHGARLFTLVPRHFGHDPPPPPTLGSLAIYTRFRPERLGDVAANFSLRFVPPSGYPGALAISLSLAVLPRHPSYRSKLS